MTSEPNSATATSPFLTIGIVFFNAMPYFSLAVQSALRQTHDDFELILLDDGSTDGSLEYARSIGDPRVRVISDGRNLKLNIRLNEIVREARGKYFFRMDADDIMFKDRLASQLAVLQRAQTEIVLGSSAVCINNEGRITGFRHAQPPPTTVWRARHAFIHPTVCGPTAWFRRNPYCEDFVFHRSQDAELWTRTFEHSTFVTVSEPCLFYRESAEVKVENYIGSALGVVIIAFRRRGSRKALAICWSGLELFKCWITIVLQVLKLSQLQIWNRQARLSAEEKAQYATRLAEVMTDPIESADGIRACERAG